MSYPEKEMVVGSEEKLGLERRRKHDPDLEALINPKFSPQIRALLVQVQTGSLDPEQAHSQILQMITDPASKDRKTGLLLGEAVAIKLTRLMEYSKTKGIPLTVVYLDANNFKQINDHPKLGHDVGDIAIKIIAEALQETTRDEDIQVRLSEERKEEDDISREKHQARMGGDEFLMVLPETTAEQASKVLNRFETKFSELSSLNDSIKKYQEIFGSPITISGGIAQYNPTFDNTPSDLIKRAEIAMQQAKPKPEVKGEMQIARVG